MSNSKPLHSISNKVLTGLLSSSLLLLSAASHASYEAFPADEGPYTSGPASSTLPWQGFNFEDLEDQALIECSNDKDNNPNIDVTSGCLTTKLQQPWQYVWRQKALDKIQSKIDDENSKGRRLGWYKRLSDRLSESNMDYQAASYLRGWTEDSVFRAVAIGRAADGREIKWTEQAAEYRGYIDHWHNNGEIPDWSGLHLFARYRTSDDLYVASVRYDGQVTIKRKWNGAYTTLAQGHLTNEFKKYLNQDGKLKENQWYHLKFTAVGKSLKLFVDGELVLATLSSTFSWGTTGIRIDNATAYIDNWKLNY